MQRQVGKAVAAFPPASLGVAWYKKEMFHLFPVFMFSDFQMKFLPPSSSSFSKYTCRDTAPALRGLTSTLADRAEKSARLSPSC